MTASDDRPDAQTPALKAVQVAGLRHTVVRTRPARSVTEAAELRGIAVGALIKTLVIRRDEDDYVFVLVPGDRVIDWPKLRNHLGVRRLSLPDAAEAQTVTGYARGTITPIGSARPLPVVADATLTGMPEVSIGGGAHGVSIRIASADLLRHLDAAVADVTKPG